ncbi:MAG: 30S ribosomal protein S21 [Gemmatimonadetes bacterium]|nr:30S ribosomal protein S21 [Gemmatimonadota bacterium]
MSEIVIGDNQRLEMALKHFRRQVQRSGILKDFRKKRFYVKPSVAKRLKSAAAQRRRREDARRAERHHN